MELQNELTIDAPVEVVWNLTQDIEGWPALTPTVTSVERLDEGPLRVGSAARVKQPGQRPTIWTVTRFEPGAVFEWEAKVYGVHTVGRHCVDGEDGACRNTLQIDMTGRGSTLLGKLLGRRIAKTIATENQGFKRAAEAAWTHQSR
jgi:uncharacterized membrane protein